MSHPAVALQVMVKPFVLGLDSCFVDMSTDPSELVEFTLGSGFQKYFDTGLTISRKLQMNYVMIRTVKKIQFNIDLNRNLIMYAPDYNDLECLILASKKRDNPKDPNISTALNPFNVTLICSQFSTLTVFSDFIRLCQ